MVPGTDDEAISVHFDQLCDDNEATSSKILHQEVLKPEDMPQIPYDEPNFFFANCLVRMPRKSFY